MRVFHIKFILAGHWWGNLILHTPPPSHKRKKERIKDTYTAKASHSSFYIIIYCRIVAYVALSDLLKYFCHPFTLQFLFEEHILEQCIVKFFVFFFQLMLWSMCNCTLLICLFCVFILKMIYFFCRSYMEISHAVDIFFHFFFKPIKERYLCIFLYIWCLHW